MCVQCTFQAHPPGAHGCLCRVMLCVHTPVMELLARCSWHWPPRHPCALEAVLLDRFPVARRQGASETICWDRNSAGRW